VALAYLDNRSPVANRIFRTAVLWGGSRIQRAGAWIVNRMPGAASTTSRGALGLVRSPMTPVPPGTLFGRLPACGIDQAVLVEPDGEVRQTVFYFPGCGSERLHSQVSLAAIHILLRAGARVVLPPPFLCCGFPARVNAKKDLHGRQTLQAAMIMSQLRERLGHLNFDAVAVSCGTCRETLLRMGVETIFGCCLSDVSRLAMGYGLDYRGHSPCLYHAPCHDSLDGEGAALLGRRGAPVVSVPHCCGEAGTLALSRPDLSAAMRTRKQEALKRAARRGDGTTTLLTNCPACLSGLGRHLPSGVRVRHLAVELAMAMDGDPWVQETQLWCQRASIITI
jgi:Fe-S oxidoreductase